jgi:hypothetical protein
MMRIAWVLAAAAALAGVVVCVVPSSGHDVKGAARVPGVPLPEGYRDWRLISVAREEGELDDVRAILGNDVAVEAYREGTLPFPDGAIIARLAWSLDASDENNLAFGRAQSFVAGAQKNGVQLMVKDSKRYASTGGWGFAHFDDGKPAGEAVLATCFPCHAAIPARDLVFTRYTP